MKNNVFDIIVLVIAFFFCSCNPNSSGENETKYLSRDLNCELSLKELTDGSLEGIHCFILQNGNRIDCCEDSTSIILFEKTAKEFSGVLKSCYLEKNIGIRLVRGNGEILLLLNEYHPFIPDTMEFFIENN